MERLEFEANTGCTIVGQNDTYVCSVLKQIPVITGDNRVANAVLEYLKSWLVNHIQRTDKKYSDFFKKNGLK